MNREPGTVKVLEIGGVPVFVHWSVAAGAGLLAVFMKFDATATLSLCFGYFFLIGLHEAAHALAARSLGLEVFSIRISGVGGLCTFQPPTSYSGAFLVVSAGLLAQILLLVSTVVCLALFGQPATRAVSYVTGSFIYLNVALIVLNLIPEKPRRSTFGTDGYLLWNLALRNLRRRPFAWPDTSATFPPETRLAQLRGFTPAGFETGIEILNDNTTPMEYVVATLTTHLQVPRDEATKLMLEIHAKGGLIITLATYEQAVAVANGIAADALASGHQLVCRPVGPQQAVPADAPDTFEQQVSVPRPIRAVLGVVVGLGALLFVAMGILMLTTDRSQMPSPNGALALGYFCIALGAGFGYIAARLVRMKATTDRLLSRKEALVAGPSIALLGALALVSTLYTGPADAATPSILFVVFGFWVYWSARRRKDQ